MVTVAVVLFAGALIRSVFGFGDAAVAMPLLALLSVRLELAVPLVGLAGMAVALMALPGGWARVDRPALTRLTISTLLGIPFGVLLVTSASEPVLMACLGTLLLLYGVYSTVGPRLPRLRQPAWAYPFGLAAGALGSAYNFNGVPVAVYGTMCGWSPDRFRGTLQAHFVISSALVVAGQGIGGLWSREMLQHFAVAVPGVLLAVPLGRALHRRVPAPAFRDLVSIVIAVLGALLLL